MKPILILVASIVILSLLGWMGLQVKPASFPTFSQPTSELKTIPLPKGLPTPVERFYREVYGENIPVIESAVISGQGTMRINGITLPVRFRFTHEAGKDYRHYFEATLFGIPLLKVNEGYLDGESFFESPMGSYYNEQNANQGANLTLWAEAIWFPSLWVTDTRARWEPVDKYTALLYVPYGEREENFIVRFNPQTGLIDMMEAMRYRDLGQGSPKILWIVRNEISQADAGADNHLTGSVMWLDQGKPWAYFNLEELVFNADVSAYIRERDQ
ncbi:hypothetical protein FBQ99_20375 [Chloroflexi bacterium CFX2]|nr:hypothetical protein [Chloroflexi bacterium CFX2]